MEFARDFPLFLFDSGIIRFGQYTLSSGRTSPYYIDLRQVLAHPGQFRYMIDALSALVEKEGLMSGSAGLVGVPTGGLAVAAPVAYVLGRPMAYVRKEAKSYGSGNQIEGMRIPRKLYTVIEDVVTTGGSIADALVPLRDAEMYVAHAFAVIDRMGGGCERLEARGVQLHSLLTIAQIIDRLQEEGRITEVMADEVRGTFYRPGGSTRSTRSTHPRESNTA